MDYLEEAFGTSLEEVALTFGLALEEVALAFGLALPSDFALACHQDLPSDFSLVQEDIYSFVDSSDREAPCTLLLLFGERNVKESSL